MWFVGVDQHTTYLDHPATFNNEHTRQALLVSSLLVTGAAVLMAPSQVSRKKESKADHLARKGANQEQLKSIVNNLESTSHQCRMTPTTLWHHNVVWQNFTIMLGSSPEITLHQQPPLEVKSLLSINAPSLIVCLTQLMDFVYHWSDRNIAII